MRDISNVTTETSDLVRGGGKGSSIRGDYDSTDKNGTNGKHPTSSSSFPKEDCQPSDKNESPREKISSFSPEKENPKVLTRKRKIFILASCVSAVFLSACASSLLTTFFANVAGKKGLDTIQTGFVFAVFEIGIFITAPFVGRYLTTIGSKFVFLFGILFAGVSNILFGVLHLCPNGTPFFVMCLLVRLVGSFGVSAFSTASFALASSYFRENIGTVLAILETGIGVGYMLGPVIGGALFELGGFGLPFYFIGGLVLINGVIVVVSLPPTEFVEENKSKQSMFRLLSSPAVHVYLLSVLFGMFSIISMDSYLAKDVEGFDLSPVYIGLLYVLHCFMYISPLPLMGYITDKKDIQTPIIVGGHLIFAVSSFLLGPNAVFPGFPFNLGSVCAGLGLMGMALGFILVPTMKCMVTEALHMGYTDDLDTYAMVSGLFYASYHLGGFLGPVLSGVIAEHYTYQAAFATISLVHVVMFVVTGVFFSANHFCTRRRGKD